MLELENFGIVEMSSQEIQEVDGGIAPLIIYGACWLGGLAVGSAIAYYYS